MATRIKASAMRRRVKRRGERASYKKKANATTLRSRKQRGRKTARKVMRGGIFSPPPPVKVYLCYKGEQVPIIDLEDETIRNKNITQRQVAESISKIDPNSIIGILFRRTVYDWKFCVFEYEPEKQSEIQFDDNDILNEIYEYAKSIDITDISIIDYYIKEGNKLINSDLDPDVDLKISIKDSIIDVKESVSTQRRFISLSRWKHMNFGFKTEDNFDGGDIQIILDG